MTLWAVWLYLSSFSRTKGRGSLLRWWVTIRLWPMCILPVVSTEVKVRTKLQSFCCRSTCLNFPIQLLSHVLRCTGLKASLDGYSIHLPTPPCVPRVATIRSESSWISYVLYCHLGCWFVPMSGDYTDQFWYQYMYYRGCNIGYRSLYTLWLVWIFVSPHVLVTNITLSRVYI